MRTPLIIVALSLSAAAACAPSSPTLAQSDGGRACFFVQEVDSFASSDDRRVYVRTGRSEVFELTTMGCSNVDWSHQIGIVPRGGGSSVCSSMDAELIVPGLPGGRATCPVTGVRRLTDTEVAALPERDRP